MDQTRTVELLGRRELDVERIGWRHQQRSLQDGSLVLLRPGIYVHGTAWRSLRKEDQIVVQARALNRIAAHRPVFAGTTAAAIHGLPLYGMVSTKLHTIAPAHRPGSAFGVIRHRGELRDGEIAEVDGLLCTTLARTVADIARQEKIETSVTVADAALRRLAINAGREYDESIAGAFVDEAMGIVGRSAHGVWRAREALAFADGRGELPGESVSRVHIARLGFEPPELQFEVPAQAAGSFYFVDFRFRGKQRPFGEFDGHGKYTDERMLAGRTTRDAMFEEKRREDWIRGTTQSPIARWEWKHLTSAVTLGARLSAFGIVPPGSR